MDNGHSIYRTDEEVIEALFKTGGNIKETAKVLGLANISALRLRVNKDSVLREARFEASEQILDVAENHVVKKVKSGKDVELIKWYLTKKGRGRGYGDVVTNVNANFNGNYDLDKMPLEERLRLLEALNGARADSD